VNASSYIEPECSEGRVGILSSDEENVLSVIRGIVADLRTRGLFLDMVVLRLVVTTAGAEVASVSREDESIHLKLGCVRFSLRCISNGGIEISFPAES
jgi:hypothetical protein